LGLLRLDAGPEAAALTLHDRRNFKMENSSNLRTDGNRLIFDRPSGLEDRLTTVQELIGILDGE
jgi:hypothetical protein